MQSPAMALFGLALLLGVIAVLTAPNAPLYLLLQPHTLVAHNILGGLMALTGLVGWWWTAMRKK